MVTILQMFPADKNMASFGTAVCSHKGSHYSLYYAWHAVGEASALLSNSKKRPASVSMGSSHTSSSQLCSCTSKTPCVMHGCVIWEALWLSSIVIFDLSSSTLMPSCTHLTNSMASTTTHSLLTNSHEMKSSSLIIQFNAPKTTNGFWTVTWVLRIEPEILWKGSQYSLTAEPSF